MSHRKKLLQILVIFALSALAISCSETGKANKFIGEGDAAVKEAEKLINESDAKINQLDNGLADFPANREQLKPIAQESIDLIDRAVAKLHEAASKYDEASKTNIAPEIKEYLSLRSQEWNKHAEHLETFKEYPKATMNLDVDRPALDKKITEIKDRIAKLKEEWNELGARAAAIREKNKDKFESENK